MGYAASFRRSEYIRQKLARADASNAARLEREAKAAAMRSVVQWHDPAALLPDDETTVLVAIEDGEVWTGFLDAGRWRYVSADAIEARVLWWAHFPAPPKP